MRGRFITYFLEREKELRDIPEFEKFDRLIMLNSWLDEASGKLVTWSRNEYDDYRREHQEQNLPTSTTILQYFHLPCNRVGWGELVQKRFKLSIPEPMEGCFFLYGEDDTRRNLGRTQAQRWEDAIDMIVDEDLGDGAIEELIDIMSRSIS